MWLPVLPPFGAFAELAVLLGAIQLAAYALPDIDILSLEPSPYWLPILLLSLQYGTVAGLLAAGAATLAYVMNGLPEQIIDEHHFAYLLRVWALPILWIGVALILGQFRLRQIERKQELLAGFEQRTREAEALSVYARDLEQRCRQLERQLTSQGTRDGAGVLDAIARLGQPGSDLAGALDDLCQAAFPGAQVTVYAAQTSAIEAAFATSGASARTRRLGADHSLYRRVIGERASISVLDAAGEAALAGEGLAAAPIVHEESGRVLGLIKLERAGAGVLTAGIGDRLAAVARLIAPMMAEPRVVVDNTAAAQSDTGAGRARARRHYSWQQGPGHHAESAPGEDRGGSRPAIHK